MSNHTWPWLFFIDDQVVECLYSQLPKNQRSYLRDWVVSVYSSVERIRKKTL